MRTALTVLSAVSALAVAGCTGIAGTETTPIPGNYLAQTVNANPLPEDVTFNLQPDGTFSGHGPCNDYSGTNAAELPNFEGGTLVTTRKSCDGNSMRFERDYFAALTAAESITQGAGGITLSNNDVGVHAQVITFVRQPATAQ